MDAVRQLLFCGLVFVPLEYVFAIRPQTLFNAERRTNLIYGLFNAVCVAVPLALAMYIVVSVLGGLVPADLKSAVSSQPLWLQAVEAAVMGDFGIYCGHRLSHHRLLWRFHAVHHSAEDMDFLVALRFHPVDLAITGLFAFVPLLLVGFSLEAIAAYKVLYSWQSFFDHANIGLRLGPLRHVFVGPEFHHWHHANQREAYDKNFSSQFVIWDWLFGTLYLPETERPARFGLTKPNRLGFVDQLIDPFRPRAMRKTAAPAALPPVVDTPDCSPAMRQMGDPRPSADGALRKAPESA